ncbi:hypothetical protein QLH32_02480 [Acinetobacter corruptisaponis]|uniref:Uncharacterized protein n=1 Tax=Acinetobacter corruptisaponis TaxID=3045147 RepID=A0ABY8S4T5_9GAMM|nr:hypothetical protein [Acinetobacter sp. KCTC 92772]WHP06351.1 hypothetical protein QLH32_02480 [Acinetobacter sp. KCTC 92772]
MNNIVEFVKPKPVAPERRITFQYNPNDPSIRADMAKADQLVSYDINTMSIDELRDHARCSIVLAHRERMRYLQECNTFKSIFHLLGAFLDRRCREELQKYRDSDKTDMAAENKALAFHEAHETLPDIIGSTYAQKML